MDEAAIQRVVNFSIRLKNSADLILNTSALVSIDTWTLFEIEEAFSLILEVEKYTNFHVLPPNNREHPAIPHIQFLYDLLQKVKRLRILTQSYHTLPIEQQINLKCFRSLNYLELNAVPINQLKGLQNVRPVLKRLTVINSCSQMNDILLKCGADMATEYSWENLEVANFSGNNLVHLDSSLRLLSAIKILDLSYCCLTDAISLFCLPTISHLNLSHNKLITMPALSETASSTLLTLNLSCNLMVDLRGIERFQNLEELHLQENCICVEETLVHLNDLPHLNYLNLVKNPISFCANYRCRVVRYLHNDIRSSDEVLRYFLLDDIPLQINERKLVNVTPPESTKSGSSLQLLKYLLDNVNKFVRFKASEDKKSVKSANENQVCGPSSLSNSNNAQCDQSSPSQVSAHAGVTRKKSRKNRIRHVSMDDVETDTLNFAASTNVIGSLTKSVMEMKAEMFGYKNYLTLPQTVEEESDLSSITGGPSHSDKLLEEILNSSLQKGLDNSEQPSFDGDRHMSLVPSNLSTSVLSSSTSSIWKLNDSFTMDLSPITTDDEESDPDRVLFSVSVKSENKTNDPNTSLNTNTNTEAEAEMVLLSFTKSYYIEKTGLTEKTMVKLPMSSLQSMDTVSISPVIVQLNFSRAPFDLGTRRFIFDIDDFESLKKKMEPIIDQNQRRETSPLPCKECGLTFLGIRAQASGTRGSTKKCRSCGNRKSKQNSIYYIPAVGTPTIADIGGLLQNINSNDTSTSTKQTDKNSLPERRHKREKSVISSDSSESVSVCSSSGTSASACNLKRTTDPDLVSNPSMSSIEVLHENSTADGEERSNDFGAHGFQEPVSAACNVDFRTPPDRFEPEIHKNNPTFGALNCKETVMQESSSSGSMSGSVCTTVDRLSSGPSTPHRHLERVPKLGDESSEVEAHIDANTIALIRVSDESHNFSASVKSTDTVCHRPATNLREAFEMFSPDVNERKGISFEDSSNSFSLIKWVKVKKLLSCYTGYSWEWWNEVGWDSSDDLPSRESNRIKFSYSDFTDVDHRLKLYCELFLFPEREEILQGLVKVIGSIDSETPFLSIFAISTRNVYMLKITSEENESLEDWIKVEASCRLEEITSIYTVFHKQGVAVKLKDKLVFLCLSDSERANKLHCFILKCLDGIGFQPFMDDSINRSQSEHLRRHLSTHLNDFNSVIHLFQIVTLLKKNGDCLNKILIVTSTRILLFKADLKWLSSTTSKPESNDCSIFRFASNFNCNLEEVDLIELYADNHFKVIFHQDEDDKGKPPWDLHVASPWVTSNIIETIKPLYEDFHGIELEVKCYSDDLTYVKEIFKDTKFASYVQCASESLEK